MPAPQNFRTAFNGFHREDVVHYLEYINAKHNAQVNSLTAENETLRAKLEAQEPSDNQQETIAALEQEREELLEKLAALQQRCEELEQQLSSSEKEEAQPANPYGPAQELEAYRRAERTERLARERAELIFHQANGVLAEATAKVDGVAAELGGMADQVIAQLSQLQNSVSASKEAFKDAASILYAIRPDSN